MKMKLEGSIQEILKHLMDYEGTIVAEVEISGRVPEQTPERPKEVPEEDPEEPAEEAAPKLHSLSKNEAKALLDKVSPKCRPMIEKFLSLNCASVLYRDLKPSYNNDGRKVNIAMHHINHMWKTLGDGRIMVREEMGGEVHYRMSVKSLTSIRAVLNPMPPKRPHPIMPDIKAAMMNDEIRTINSGLGKLTATQAKDIINRLCSQDAQVIELYVKGRTENVCLDKILPIYDGNINKASLAFARMNRSAKASTGNKNFVLIKKKDGQKTGKVFYGMSPESLRSFEEGLEMYLEE